MRIDKFGLCGKVTDFYTYQPQVSNIARLFPHLNRGTQVSIHYHIDSYKWHQHWTTLAGGKINTGGRDLILYRTDWKVKLLIKMSSCYVVAYRINEVMIKNLKSYCIPAATARTVWQLYAHLLNPSRCWEHVLCKATWLG